MKLKLVMLALIVCLILISCSSRDGGDDFEKDKSYKLKVMAADEQSFMTNYGNYVKARFPNVEFQVIPINQIFGDEDLQESLLQLVAAEQPDVFVGMPFFMIRMLQDSNGLVSLSNVIGKDTLSEIHPGVKQLMEHLGEGEIYSIPTSFISQVLFYNKRVFAEQGITLPIESTNWQEFLQLIRRFVNTDSLGLYLSYSDPSALLTQIGQSEGLAYISPQSHKVTLNTDSWANIAGMVKELYREGVINDWDSADSSDLFLQGKAAIMVGDSSYYTQLEAANLPFEWGVLPLPGADQTKIEIQPEGLVAINSKSQHEAEAVRFIRFLLSDQMADIINHTTNLLPSALSFSYNTDANHPLHFLYTRDADTFITENEERIFSMSGDFQKYMAETMKRMVLDEVGLREGLQLIEEFGNNQTNK
ncbi:ABC transporter substrate-binding protein [Paenibacillus kobensis]|uniref:ABC transporter substrate-binding protein n=1 Tax=Paenibacillus kobensis TaxID=59841 RepID=UPI000FD8809A|nr:extracellular solute-binding protein [Paenibacillus kobensis]